MKGKYEPLGPRCRAIASPGSTGTLIIRTSQGAPVKAELLPVVNEASKPVPFWAQVKKLLPLFSHK